MKKIVNFIALLVLVSAIPLQTSIVIANNNSEIDAYQIFLNANQAYKQKEYDQAITYYKKLLIQGKANGQIYYNLGNAYFKKGQIGKALVNYRKAEILLPRDEDLQANIQYTLQLTKDKIESKEFLAFLRNFCFWYSKLNNRELITLFLVVNALLWSIAVLRLFYKKESLSFCLQVLVFFVALLGLSSGIKLYTFYTNHNGVVVVKEINVRSGNSLNDTILFQLHEGTEFKWEDENEAWVKIRLGDGKKGWVQLQNVEKIALH